MPPPLDRAAAPCAERGRGRCPLLAAGCGGVRRCRLTRTFQHPSPAGSLSRRLGAHGSPWRFRHAAGWPCSWPASVHRAAPARAPAAPLTLPSPSLGRRSPRLRTKLCCCGAVRDCRTCPSPPTHFPYDTDKPSWRTGGLAGIESVTVQAHTCIAGRSADPLSSSAVDVTNTAMKVVLPAGLPDAHYTVCAQQHTGGGGGAKSCIDINAPDLWWWRGDVNMTHATAGVFLASLSLCRTFPHVTQ